MTVRDVDVEYPFDDPDDGWFGRAIVMEDEPEEPEVDATPEPVEGYVEAQDEGSGYLDADVDAGDSVDTDRWYVPMADPAATESVAAPPEAPVPEVHPVDDVDDHVDTDRWFVPAAEDAVVDPSPETQEPETQSVAEVATTPHPDSWQFTSSPATTHRWYRSRYTVVAAVLAAAVAVVNVTLVVRTPGPSSDDATQTAPRQTSTPAPSVPAPALSAQAPEPMPPPGPPPPPDPPPPPPAAEEISPPPVNRQYSPSYQAPDQPQKPPQMDVTRAPMSATPPPPPTQDRNSATPGDAPKRRHFF